MVHSQSNPGFTFGGPGLYRVVVQGHLDPSDADRLCGMTITTAAARERHLPILEVEPINKEVER